MTTESTLTGTCGSGCGCGVSACGPLAAIRKPAAMQGAITRPDLAIREVRIAVSYQCNLRCMHCYVPEEHREQYAKYYPDALSTDELVSVVTTMAGNFGTKRISITGGEALMTPVWPRTERVMQAALESGLKVRLITGGAAQTPISTVLAAARRSDDLTFQVSLDGTDDAMVSKFRGRPYAYQRAVETIGTIAASGSPVFVRYTITEENYDQTVGCYDMVSELGAAAFVVKPVFSLGEAARNANTVHIDESTVRDLQLRLVEHSRGRRTKLKLPQPCYVGADELPHDANVEIMYCGCGRNVAYLAPNGDVYPCTYIVGMQDMSEHRLGNLRDPGFDLAAAWQAEDTYSTFRNAPKECHCTANELAKGDEQLVCRP
ncbi:radical SAM protein [Actinoplanes subglobosus]|uniref:Radical SAM protein n=1 Tax=Actinoplanes subglobosus TaxID=1547892 RepID=A0ABV8ITF5_9ACTN